MTDYKPTWHPKRNWATVHVMDGTPAVRKWFRFKWIADLFTQDNNTHSDATYETWSKADINDWWDVHHPDIKRSRR